MTRSIETSEEYIQASNSKEIQLYLKQWIPSDVVATLVFVHGIGEHCNRYNELVTAFASNGIKVVSFDQRGFGMTCLKNGYKGVSDGIQTTMNDIELVVETYREGKLFIMGHSMGGGLILRFAQQYEGELHGIIASGS